MESKSGIKSVPRFGGWDNKKTETPDYTLVFSQARANRRFNKSGWRPASLGGEEEFVTFANLKNNADDDSNTNMIKEIDYTSGTEEVAVNRDSKK
ncbi:hypothetical protein Cni_G13287 [Canna indica]|uniref:RIN4 pathogenic type III effector avirulence factor Avr cleavage site domain-containing protein n=1 Tax=Canna indica TaxID=4628 RepID=A0AAQ3Q9Q5_9LILI|nr:hypothetical protein Cni_G13287 [Canna indica]